MKQPRDNRGRYGRNMNAPSPTVTLVVHHSLEPDRIPPRTAIEDTAVGITWLPARVLRARWLQLPEPAAARTLTKTQSDEIDHVAWCWRHNIALPADATFADAKIEYLKCVLDSYLLTRAS